MEHLEVTRRGGVIVQTGGDAGRWRAWVFTRGLWCFLTISRLWSVSNLAKFPGGRNRTSRKNPSGSKKVNLPQGNKPVEEVLHGQSGPWFRSGVPGDQGGSFPAGKRSLYCSGHTNSGCDGQQWSWGLGPGWPVAGLHPWRVTARLLRCVTRGLLGPWESSREQQWAHVRVCP